MASVTSFIRNTPAASLRAYFDHSGITLPVPVNWEAPEPEVVRPLLRAVDEMDEMAKARVVNDGERVSTMADEAGQTAIYSVAQDPDQLDDLQNAHDRALWMFLHDRAGFRHAEEVRYTDERRRGRMWDGFIGEPELVPHARSGRGGGVQGRRPRALPVQQCPHRYLRPHPPDL